MPDNRFEMPEGVGEAQAVAVLLARGYLRWQVRKATPDEPKPNLASLSTCLDLSAPIVVSVPTGLQAEEFRPPRNDHELEAEAWL